ncbi:hypothetical protein LA081_00320 [Mycoplasmopsis synoviae]|nr:hypothetical protein LA081_00320 [Mycoplasmopsis synoviae]
MSAGTPSESASSSFCALVNSAVPSGFTFNLEKTSLNAFWAFPIASRACCWRAALSLWPVGLFQSLFSLTVGFIEFKSTIEPADDSSGGFSGCGSSTFGATTLGGSSFWLLQLA